MISVNENTSEAKLTFEKPSVTLVDHMGTDCSVVNAARVSFAKEVSEMSEKDEKLIKYLATHKHWTPFAHTSISLRFSAPVFLARQLVKHQVGGVWNEESRRYITDDVSLYMPKEWRKAPTGSIKQGSGEAVSEDIEALCDYFLENLYDYSLEVYNTLLDLGVCPEQARMVLPLGHMTHWIWTGSLYFWARVYHLRADAHAQKDHAPLVADIDEIMTKLFPISWKCLKENYDE